MTDSFSNLKDILGNVQIPNITPLYGKIISEWKDIVGKKFANKSEVNTFLNKGSKIIMLVHVDSSPLVQELSFLKLNIIKKIENIYELKLDDIIIKVAPKKQQNTYSNKETMIREVFDTRPTEEELEKITLSQDTIEKIKISVEKQSALSDEQKEKMLNVIFNDLKTQEWMKQKGFPVCKICGCVITEKNFGEENICKFCKK